MDIVQPGAPGEIRASEVRSFVRRGGRVTEAQKRALATHWLSYGLTLTPARLDPRALFVKPHPVTLEIGFGAGDTLLEAATACPERNFLGVEVYEPGIGRLLMGIAQRELENLRVLRGDAVAVLDLLPERGLDAIWIFFPDPWPKKRHHKRRLISPPFAACLEQKLAAGGRLQLATDWQDYAERMLAVLDATPGLDNELGVGNFAPRPIERKETRFERRGRDLGHSVRDLRYRQGS